MMTLQTIKNKYCLFCIMLSMHVLASPVIEKPKIMFKKLELNILNGHKADIRRYPHSVFIFADCSGMDFSCTGSLIYPYIVLTAGHCVSPCVDDPKFAIIVTVGSSDINKGTKVRASHLILHEDYDEDTAQNDIAMILLNKFLERSITVNFIKLAYPGFPQYEHISTAGWGITQKGGGGEPSAKLLVCTERLNRYEKCESFLPITENHFCTLLKENHCETLVGDSGGAVTTLDIQYQVGIVSYGDENESVSVSVNVTKYLPWIYSKYKDVSARILFTDKNDKTEKNETNLLFKSLNLTHNSIPGMLKAVYSNH